MKKAIKICIFLLLFSCMLLYPAKSVSYAAAGLSIWFDRMIPTLFPFMILSTVMIRQNLSESLVRFLYPVFGRLYGISKNGVYCLLLGFLCGFPMGAKTVAQLYENHSLCRQEADFLLAFCNNIGPIYYISFLLPVTALSAPEKLPFLVFGMYGIPLLYGLFLRCRRKQPFENVDLTSQNKKVITEDFVVSLNYAMQGAVNGITMLGGYMILCNLMNLLPDIFFLLIGKSAGSKIHFAIKCLLEMNSGVCALGSVAPLFVLTILPVGGLSCILQTASVLNNTDLSIQHYLLHKTIQCLITFLYYFLLRFFLF